MKKSEFLNVIKYYFNQLMKYKFYSIVLLISWISVNLLTLIIPKFYKEFIDIVAIQSWSDKQIILEQLLSIFWYMILLYIWIWISRRVLEYFITKLETNIMSDVWVECFDYIHRHSYKFFSNNFSWSLVKKINRLIWSMEWLTDVFMFDGIRIILWFIVVTLFISYENINLWIVFIIWIIIFTIITYYLNKQSYPYWQKAVEHDSKVSWALADSITNNFNISIFGTLKQEYKRFTNVIKLRQDAQQNSWFRSNINYAILSVFSIIMELLMVYMWIYLWYKWLITIWTFVLILSYQWIISWQLFSISHILRKANTIIWNASEMIDIFHTSHDILDKSDKDLIVDKWNIQFKNMTFSYNKNTVIDKFNLDIKSWEKVALVWVSWSWKSTIVKLIFRFYDIDSWFIYIDWQDISQVRQESLRSSISMVPQEPVLFHRSLKENIMYANPDVTEEEFMKVSKLSHCHEFISKLPDWYNTFVWERWIKLSWWEKQRVAIARALLSNNKILIMDEATSSLDSESEYLIQDALDNLMWDKTMIVIAHRLSTIMKMDRIIVLENWKIIEQWTHTELINKNWWTYKKLWDIQSGWFLS